MARGRSAKDTTTLEAALVGLELKRNEINQLIEDIKTQLGARTSKASAGLVPASVAKTQGPRKKRVLSAEARRRIAAAQKRRWAEHRKKAAKSE
jgi:hypothetical protein